MNGNPKPEWRTEHMIASYDVDPHRTARLPALCRFMQETAYHHAEALGFGHDFLAAKNLGWVLARQRIVVEQLPKWGDTVHIRTWPSGRDRLFFHRDFEVLDGSGRRVLIASNAWSLIDIEKRARANPAIYMEVELPEGPPVFDARPSRLKGEACEHGERLPVTYGDLDLNGHVNNVRYMEWALNQLPRVMQERHSIREMECNYLAEAVDGQPVTVCFEEIGTLEFMHGVRAEGQELFRAWTRFRRTDPENGS